jgi:hypothetical protein
MWKFCYPVRTLKTEGLLTESQMKQIFDDIFEQNAKEIKKKIFKIQIEHKLEQEKVRQKSKEKTGPKQSYLNDMTFLFSNRMY